MWGRAYHWVRAAIRNGALKKSAAGRNQTDRQLR
jgi:hypothetical protein